MSVAAAKAGGVTAPVMPWVAGCLLGISFISSSIASSLDYSEFEKFVAATLFYEGWSTWFSSNTLDTSIYNTSHKMGQKLYKEAGEMALKSYTGFGFDRIDLRIINNMYDVLTSLYTMFRFTLSAQGSRIATDASKLKYHAFKLHIKYLGGIFSSELLEYEARLYSDGEVDDKSPYKVIDLYKDGSDTKDNQVIQFRVDTNTIYGNEGNTATRNAQLLVLVRVKSLEKSPNGEPINEYFPSMQGEKAVYFGKKVDIVSDFYKYYGFSNIDLRSGTINEFLK